MENPKLSIGSYVPDFELPGVDGNVHHLARYLESHQAVAVVFLSNQCPYVLEVIEQLKALQTEFQPAGLTLIAINATDASQFPGEGFEFMKEFAQQQQLNFPYIRDFSQDVAYSFGVKVTPTVFLIDRQGKLSYQGSITALRESITALLGGKNIPVAVTRTQGTKLLWRNANRAVE